MHCLLGNHEHAHIGGPATYKFHDDEAAALEAKLDEAGRARLKAAVQDFPLVAVGPCGVVLLHAAPSANLAHPDELEAVRLRGYQQMDIMDFARVPLLVNPRPVRGAQRVIPFGPDEAALRVVPSSTAA
ncbi:MAG: hypothetical protein AMXMBFR34_12360 [Myxococcaceae bacterium]